MTGRGAKFIKGMGAVFFAAGVFFVVSNILFILDSQKLEGTVVGYESRRQTSRGTVGYTDAPIVEFSYQGKTLRIPSQISSAWHGYDPGDQVTIFFNPADTKEVLPNSFYHKYGFGGFFLLLGILMWFLPRIETALVGKQGK